MSTVDNRELFLIGAAVAIKAKLENKAVWVIIYNKNFTDPDWGQLNSFYNSSLVGASGSLFGVLLAFGMMWPNANLYMMFLPIPIKAKYFIPLLLAYDFISGIAGSSCAWTYGVVS